MSQGKTYTFQRQGLEDTIISVVRGQGKSGYFFSKTCIHPDVIQAKSMAVVSQLPGVPGTHLVDMILIVRVHCHRWHNFALFPSLVFPNAMKIRLNSRSSSQIQILCKMLNPILLSSSERFPSPSIKMYNFPPPFSRSLTLLTPLNSRPTPQCLDINDQPVRFYEFLIFFYNLHWINLLRVKDVVHIQTVSS